MENKKQRLMLSAIILSVMLSSFFVCQQVSCAAFAAAGAVDGVGRAASAVLDGVRQAAEPLPVINESEMGWMAWFAYRFSWATKQEARDTEARLNAHIAKASKEVKENAREQFAAVSDKIDASGKTLTSAIDDVDKKQKGFMETLTERLGALIRQQQLSLHQNKQKFERVRISQEAFQETFKTRFDKMDNNLKTWGEKHSSWQSQQEARFVKCNDEIKKLEKKVTENAKLNDEESKKRREVVDAAVERVNGLAEDDNKLREELATLKKVRVQLDQQLKLAQRARKEVEDRAAVVENMARGAVVKIVKQRERIHEQAKENNLLRQQLQQQITDSDFVMAGFLEKEWKYETKEEPGDDNDVQPVEGLRAVEKLPVEGLPAGASNPTPQRGMFRSRAIPSGLRPRGTPGLSSVRIPGDFFNGSK